MADIHILEDGWLLKLYRKDTLFEQIAIQHRIDIYVATLGLPVPSVRPELAHVLDWDRFGIVYERIPGVSMAVDMGDRPWQLFHHAATLARHHAQIHTQFGAAELPSLKQRLAAKIADDSILAAEHRNELQVILERLPDGETLCHGDYHWENLVVGPARLAVVDWSDTSYGNPICDAARSWVLCGFNYRCGDWMTRRFCRLFANLYLRHYLRHTGLDGRDVAAWQLVNAAARMQESITPLEKSLLSRFITARLRIVQPKNLR